MQTSSEETFTSPFEFKTEWKNAFDNDEFRKIFALDILENYIINKRWYGGKASTLKYIEVVDHLKLPLKKTLIMVF
jgi:maltokinase